jgi:hypothetical protein
MSRLVPSRGQQPRVDKAAEHHLEAVVPSGWRKLTSGRVAAGVFGALAGLGEAQQRAARDVLLFGAQLVVDLVGALRQCAVHAAGLPVALEGQHGAPAALPQLE